MLVYSSEETKPAGFCSSFLGDGLIADDGLNSEKTVACSGTGALKEG